MTGGGVNDAPSPKEADVGIALRSGLEIAKRLLIRLFCSPFSHYQAIIYGEAYLDNHKKITCYLLPAGTFSEL